MIDVDRIRAIDVHTHAEVTADGHDPMPPALRAAARRYFRSGDIPLPAAHDVAAYYRERTMAAVVFGVDYPIYEAIEEAGVPALFHTGHSGIGAGLPGGGGIHLKYSNPMYVDDVAVDFPELKIVLAHPSFPWQDEAISIALHKPQVHIDLSGWSPKYFPPQLVQYARTLLKRQVLFGSDFPMITPDRWLADFEQLGFDAETTALILKENAARLLGLRPGSGVSAAPA